MGEKANPKKMPPNNEIFNKFTHNARLVLAEAQAIAQKENKPLSTGIMLLAIAQVPSTLSHDILKEYSITYDQIKLVLSLNLSKSREGNVQITKNAREVLKTAFQIAGEFQHYNVDTEHILIALLSNAQSSSYKIIEHVGINPVQLKDQLLSIFTELSEMDQMIKRQSQEIEQLSSLQPPMPENMPQTAHEAPFLPTPGLQKVKPKGVKTLEYFAQNLVEKAKNGEIDPVIGRENEINRSIQIILRKTKNNPVFIGEPGVGKTAIVEGLAFKIAKGKVPQKLLGKKIYQLDLGLLVAGTMYRGQFEDRLKKVLAEIKQNKDAIVFIDEMHSIVGTGSAEGSMDAANLLKPALAKGEIRLIGATTLDEYRKHIEKDSALERRFQPIIVREPTIEETINILDGIKASYEKHHGLKIDQSAITAAANMSEKYINDRFLPDKAIDLLDEASARKVLLNQKVDGLQQNTLKQKLTEIIEKKEELIAKEDFEKAAQAKTEEARLRDQLSKIENMVSLDKPMILCEEDIAALVHQITNIPIGDLVERESKKYLDIESEISKHIVGQKEAIKKIAQALRRNRSGVSEGKKPIGSFIFLGPSGVGKTEIAKVLAKHIYSSEEALIKIDMSEFMERHSSARLVGAPPGYIGYEDAGKLTERVRKNPYSIILFDEIEKAHPDVFNLLLQILDDGTLTDAKGRVVSFLNTIIIMTSNVGIEQYDQISKIGFETEANTPDLESLKSVVSEKLDEVFRPEFINRLDGIIVFDPLSLSDLEKIAKIKLKTLQERLKKSNIEVSFTPAVYKQLAIRAENQSFGARPLQRMIEDKIENILSEEILKTKIKKFTIDYTHDFIARKASR